MGVALDEPQKEDLLFELQGVKMAAHPELTGMIERYGEFFIDYNEHSWFNKGFVMRFAFSAGAC